MLAILFYKGYEAVIGYSVEDKCLYGRVPYITDRIIFEVKDMETAFSSFKEAIDNYLELCALEDKRPALPKNFYMPHNKQELKSKAWSFILNKERKECNLRKKN
jgi:predicted RNase H-like HicB family nuclease